MAVQPHEIQQFLERGGREQGPEFDQSLTFTPSSKLVTLAPIKTDRFISLLLLHWSGRIVIATAPVTANADSVVNLFNEVRIRGTHVRLSTFTPLRLRGAHIYRISRNYRPNYSPSQYGLSGFGAIGTYDVDFFLPIWVYPVGIPWNSAILYSIKGPEWPGNLKVEIDTGDATAFNGVVANTTFSAKGSGTGSPTINIYTVRPLLGKDMNGLDWQDRITPAVPLISYQSIDAVLQGTSNNNVKLTDLNTDRFASAYNLFTGTLQTGLTSGLRAFSSYSDAMVTNIYLSLDDHQIGNQQSNLVQKEWNALSMGRNVDTGVQSIDFTTTSGNPDSGFQAIGLTAARRFQLKGNVVAGANQVGDLIEFGYVGKPTIV